MTFYLADLSDILSGNLHIFWHSGIFSDMMSSYDILSGISSSSISSDILTSSGISGMSSDILSGILSVYLLTFYLAYLLHSIWQLAYLLTFYQDVFWHSIWHIYSVWHVFWHSSGTIGILSGISLTFYGILCLLRFCLSYLLIFCLAYLLTFYLAFYLAYLQIFYLAYFLTFYLAYLLTFYLANLLTFYLAYLSDILSGVSIWHSVWHIFWHSIWHIFWCSIWHSIWDFLWHLYGFVCGRWGPFEVWRGPQRSESRRLRSGEAHSAPNLAGWGPARPTALRLSPVEVTAIESWQMGSGEDHCDRELAVEVRRGPLRSRAGRWGPARKEWGRKEEGEEEGQLAWGAAHPI